MDKILKNKGGEAVLETLIALTILAVGITLSATIIATSIRNMNASKNRIVAINIARQGIEAMRNIRDTNWLKFHSKRRACWNHNPGDAPDPCNGTNPILPGNYIIYKEEVSETWRLDSIDTANNYDEDNIPDPCAEGNLYYNTTYDSTFICDGGEWKNVALLYLVDIDPSTDSNKDEDFDNDMDVYNHVHSGINVWGTQVRNTTFARTITIHYLDDDSTVKDSMADPNNHTELAPYNRMLIIAKVEWYEGKSERRTELRTHLTDYLGREVLGI